MSRIAITTLALLLLAPLTASWGYRILEENEGAYELVLGEVSLPSTAGGTVGFKACEECPPQSLRVSSATLYFLKEAELSFVEFAEAGRNIRQMDEGDRRTAVYVFYDLDTERVNRLVLDPLF